MDWLICIGLLAVAAGMIAFYKREKILSFIEGLNRPEDFGLEFLKLPEGDGKVKGVELIHFKGEHGIELLVPPWLQDLKKKKESTTVRPLATLLTGKNLTGYFLLLTKMLFHLEERPVFLVAKERDIELFKRHSNVVISIFKHKNALIEELKKLKYEFHKGLISEEEFKKKVMEMRSTKSERVFTEPLYDSYKYFSNPGEILKDAQNFLNRTKNRGIIVVTIIDEMLEKSPRQSRAFIESLLKLCTNHSTPLVLTAEEGVFNEKVTNTIRSYCDMVMETSLEKEKRYVTVYSFEKVFPKKRVSEVVKGYGSFLKKIGFLE